MADGSDSRRGWTRALAAVGLLVLAALFALRYIDAGTASGIRPSGSPVDSASTPVDVDARGAETRSVVADVPATRVEPAPPVLAAPATVAWFRVLAGPSNEPIPDALLTVQWDRMAWEHRSDAEGWIQVTKSPTSADDMYGQPANLSSRGFAPLVVLLQRGFETRASARVVRLSPEACLELRASDVDGRPLPGVALRLTAWGMDLCGKRRSMDACSSGGS